MKRYKAIYFDWDGTAVLSRKAPVDDAVNAMRPLLDKGIKLVIVSGTTYENIANGSIHECFTASQLQNLFLGLGRGAFDYGFDGNGQPVLIKSRIPDKATLLTIHDACYKIHRTLLGDFGLNTDIVFSRPNYCKIDLLPNQNREDKLFLQEGESAMLQDLLEKHGIGGVDELIHLVERFELDQCSLKATTDAKYLEVGPTGKCDNVDAFYEMFNFEKDESCFWGDEFIGVSDTVFGSDSGMITPKTCECDFFDVSDIQGIRPQIVKLKGGGIKTFLQFLKEQNV